MRGAGEEGYEGARVRGYDGVPPTLKLRRTKDGMMVRGCDGATVRGCEGIKVNICISKLNLRFYNLFYLYKSANCLT